MQNNFDKLNEIFGVGKTEPEQKPDTAAEPEAPAAGAPAEEGGQEHGRADDETKILPSIKPQGGLFGRKRAKEEQPEQTGDEQPEEQEEPEPEERSARNPLKFIDDLIYDHSKNKDEGQEGGKDEEPEEDFEDEPLEERDFMPIRPRRDGKTGCLGGLMYFVFVISLSVILACVGWMAASDVLALNKEYTEGTVTLPESIFTEKEIEVENEDGSVTQKTVMSADLDYVANALKDAGLIEYKGLFKFFCRFTDADIDMDPGTYELNTKCDYNALVLRMQTASISMVTTTITFPEGYTMQQIFEKLEEEGICSVEDLEEAAANYVYNYSFLDWSDAGRSQPAWRATSSRTPTSSIRAMQASSAINQFPAELPRQADGGYVHAGGQPRASRCTRLSSSPR